VLKNLISNIVIFLATILYENIDSH